jgi:7-cyano-7-deazaguanine reductase
MTTTLLENTILGKDVTYDQTYAPELLFRVPRKMQREELGIHETLPFQGDDVWNAFEISWLNPKGKPEVALGEFTIPCHSPNLIESKSLKLYLGSLYQTVFPSMEAVRATIEKDLSHAAGAAVAVNIISIAEANKINIEEFSGVCLDQLDVTCNTYKVNSSLLTTENMDVEETLYSHLFKSNCLVTGQPDWGSVQIIYQGKKINHENLLRYIVSYRNHQGFHEQCIERLFMDIWRLCKPERLTIHGRYTRRGGLDINPTRSTRHDRCGNIRLCRQ